MAAAVGRLSGRGWPVALRRSPVRPGYGTLNQGRPAARSRPGSKGDPPADRGSRHFHQAGRRRRREQQAGHAGPGDGHQRSRSRPGSRFAARPGPPAVLASLRRRTAVGGVPEFLPARHAQRAGRRAHLRAGGVAVPDRPGGQAAGRHPGSQPVRPHQLPAPAAGEVVLRDRAVRGGPPQRDRRPGGGRPGDRPHRGRHRALDRAGRWPVDRPAGRGHDRAAAGADRGQPAAVRPVRLPRSGGRPCAGAHLSSRPRAGSRGFSVSGSARPGWRWPPAWSPSC